LLLQLLLLLPRLGNQVRAEVLPNAVAGDDGRRRVMQRGLHLDPFRVHRLLLILLMLTMLMSLLSEDGLLLLIVTGRFGTFETLGKPSPMVVVVVLRARS